MFTFRRPAIAARRPRRTYLRIDGLEERTVPAVGVGANFTSTGSDSIPAVGNSGAVGPTNFVQFQVGRFIVYSKTGSLIKSVTDTAFWQSAGVGLATVAQGLVQPRITYDPLTNRWFAMEINLEDVSNKVLIARSDTADPAGTWKAVEFIGRGGRHVGFPTLAVDANGVYVGTADFFSRSIPFPDGGTMISIPKADLLLATPDITRRTTLSQAGPSAMGWGLQAVTNFNLTADHASVVATHYEDFHKLNVTRITGTGAPNAQFGSTTTLAINNTSLPGESRQPGNRLISGGDDDRYTGAIFQFGDLIYAAHTISVDASGSAAAESAQTTNAIHLIVLRDTATGAEVVAQGTYYNTAFDYSFPSVSANQYGDILIGLNRSGSALGSGPTDGRVGAYAVYARINPANPTAITFGQEIQLKAGEATYQQQGNGTAVEAWGPYSATTIDPTNPLAFWTTQQWARTAAEWRTQISQVFVSPRTTNVSSTAADGTYGVGASIPITVSFNHDVVVTGTPRLLLNNGAYAVYSGGSGESTLTFTYTVAGGQSIGDLDYASSAALDLNGGTIKDETSNLVAELALPAPGAAGSLGANKNITIDAVTAAVTSVSSTSANGTYLFGSSITITVTFDRAVNVTGTPQLALDSGGTANYLSGSGTTVLTFAYTVGAGHVSADLDYTSTSALTLNGGTIVDALNSAPASRVLPAPGAAGSLGMNKNLVVDAAPPRVTAVSSTTADGTYGFGQLISVTVTFQRAVNVTGTPQLALNSGGTATYASGSGTTVLTFHYTVGTGDAAADLDYTSTSALTLNGGTITEVGSGQNANRDLPTPGDTGSLGANKNIAISALPAQVTNVTSPTLNGTYGSGTVINITVQFNRAVTVTGTPQLVLNSGGTANYVSGSGNTVLTFAYTVGTSDASLDLDYASTSALTLNGGTIRDANSLDANLTLPSPGASGSLGANKAIVIDSSGPVVLQYRVLFGSRKYNLVGASRTDLPWLVTGVQVVFSEPVYSGNVRSLSGLTATRFSGLRTRTLTWNFPAVAKGTFSTALANTGLNTLKDRSGNPIAAFSQAFRVLYGDFTGDGAVTAADEAGVRANLYGPYQLNSTGYNIFADLSGDGLVNLTDVSIAKKRLGATGF